MFLPNLILGNNLLLFNANNQNHPTLETYVAYFDDNFEPVELKISNSKLKVNGNNAKIDSIILVNTSVKIPLNLTVAFELSPAINQDDIEFYKKVYDYYSNINKSIFKNVNFVLVAENPIFLFQTNLDKNLFDSLKIIQFVKKTDLNKLLNSTIFVENQKGNNNAFLLITKSLIKVNSEKFINYINSTQTKFFHINLSLYNYPLYDELCKATNSISIDKSNFLNIDKILKISAYILSSNLYQRLYFSEFVKIGQNSIEFNAGNDKDTLWFNLYENDFPFLEIKENINFFGILDSGVRRLKTIKIQSRNRQQIITRISSNNPNFRVLNFLPNTKLQPNDELEISIEYNSVSNSFDSSVITLSTNYGKDYYLYMYGGKPKNFSSEDLKFVGLDNNILALSGDVLKLQWLGSHPLDTFMLQYKIKDEPSWRLITNSTANNTYNWIVPDLSDTTIKIRISQTNKNLISEKVILLDQHRAKITKVSFSPDDSLLATAGEDGFIYLWDTKTGKREKILFQSQSKIISDIDWSKDGKYLAIAAMDTSIKIWSIESDVLFKDITTTSKIVNIGFSFDGNYLVARSIDNKVFTWKFPSLELMNTYQIPFEPTFFELNPNYHNFLATSLQGNIIVYDYLQQKNVSTFPLVEFPLLSGSFSPSGNNIVVAGIDNKIRIFDIFSGYNVLTLFDTETQILSVNWLKNRQFIATASNKFIKLWSPANGELIEIYDQHSSAVYYIKSNNKGTFVASVDQNNIIHLWSPFDFPFIKPLAVSLESPDIKIATKKVLTKTYFLSNLQVSDTLSFYFEQVGLNKTERNIIVDTLTISVPPNFISIDEKYSNFLFPQNAKLVANLNYIPKNYGNIQFQLNIKSGYRQFSTQVYANVLPNILDKKFVEIDFGKLQIGKSKDTSVFILQNIGDSPITIDSIKFFNGNDIKLVSLELPYEIRKIGGVFAPTFRFAPTRFGVISGFLRIYLNKLLPIDVYFYGEGIAPKLELVEVPVTVSNLCASVVSFPLLIQNTGNANLEIKEIHFESNIKNELQVKSYPSIIKPNFIDTIWVEWTPKNIGSNPITIEIYTNFQANYQNNSKFQFNLKNDFLKFEINPNPTIFEPINDQNQIQKTIVVENLGSVRSDLRIVQNPKYFFIDSVRKTHSGALLYVRFLGGEQQDFYTDTIKIADDCDKTYIIELFAIIKNNQPILTIQDSIGFYLVCEQRAEQKIPIYNFGKTDLIISEITFSEPISNIEVLPKELIIPPNSFSYIVITFQSTVAQKVTNQMLLKTNAINHQQGIAKVMIKAIKEIISYEFSVDTLNFGNIVQQDSVEKFIYFTNTGTLPINNNFENHNKIFSIYYTEEANILPNQSKKISIIKNTTNEIGVVLDSLVYVDICGNKRKVILIVNSSKIQPTLSVSYPYPNPTNDKTYLYIKSNFSYNLSYQLFDYLGKIAQQDNFGQIYQNEKILEIDLNNYSSGIYLLKLFVNENEFQFKVIKIN